MADTERLAGYRVDRVIARSSIATIYQGYQESLDRKVLIKQLHPQLIEDEEIRSRFEREARLLARIKHKSIVHIYDYRVDEELVLLVSEWISGGSLEERLKQQGALDEAKTVALAVDTLEALALAHREGIIHRDIKPANLLITSGGMVKITDFGLAQFEEAPHLTQQGSILGTPAYIAPELVAGASAEARCDLFSLGVTLYEVLVGENPFRGESVPETLNRITQLKPERLEGVREELNDFLQLLLAKRPERRPADAAEALELLRPLARDLGVERGLESFRAVAAQDQSARDQTPATIRPARRPAPPLWTLWLAGGLILSTLTAVWLLAPSPDPVFTTAGQPAGEDLQQVDPPPAPARDTLALDPFPDPGPELQAGTPGGDVLPEEQPDQPEVGEMSSETPATIDGPAQDTAPGVVGEEGAVSQPAVPAEEELPGEDEAVQPTTLETERESVPSGPGYLRLTVYPWANVYQGARQLAQTPVSEPLEVDGGPGELTLIHPEFPPMQIRYTVSPGDTTSVEVNLYDQVAVVSFIDAVPWAEVYLDGDYLGRTPIGREVFVAFGEHELLLRHPRHGEKRLHFTAVPDRPPLRFREVMGE